MANKSLCPSCSNSIRCNTWSEYKCSVKKRRVYEYKTVTKCDDYKKRDKNFIEPTCQCKSCLDNENLLDEESED